MANNRSWAVFPLKSLMSVQEQPVDVYVIVNYDDAKIVGFFTFLGDLPSEKEVKAAFKRARKTAGGWPSEVLLQKEDPCEVVFQKILIANRLKGRIVPTTQLEFLRKPVQDSFDIFQSGGKASRPPNPDLESLEHAKAGIPESYDLCPCNSGKKYKFCCKVIFREINEAMCAVETGNFAEAMKWLEAARSKVGDTGEIACREAIVFSIKSETEFSEKLHDAIRKYPDHPRLHYLLGIEHKQAGRFKEAEAAYLAAIDRYPKTDKYRLNETWNNLGTVYHDMGDFRQAKNAWEKALGYIPIDETCKHNLIECIYENPDLDEETRKPSPFIKQYL